MQHWVDFGSLLGLIRNGDLILHDNDVDVVVLDPDWPRLQEQLTARLGHKYKVRRLPACDGRTVRQGTK